MGLTRYLRTTISHDDPLQRPALTSRLSPDHLWLGMSAGALAKRNLRIAEIKVGDRTESFPLVAHGFQLLMDSWPSFPNDPAVLTGIGKALLAAGHGAETAAVFQQAIQIEPENALNYLHAGLAWKAARRNTEAIQSLEKAIQLDPLLEQPYRERADVYSDARDLGMIRQTYERFLKAFPKSIRAQSAVLNSNM